MFAAAANSIAFIILAGIPPGMLKPLDPAVRLDAVLIEWAERSAKVESFIVRDCTRTEKDSSGIKTWKGENRYLKPKRAALSLAGSDYELLILNGNLLYEYRPWMKKLFIHEVPERIDLLHLLDSFSGRMVTAWLYEWA